MIVGIQTEAGASSQASSHDDSKSREKPRADEAEHFRQAMRGESRDDSRAQLQWDERKHEDQNAGAEQNATIPLNALYQPVDFPSSANLNASNAATQLQELLATYADRVVAGRIGDTQAGQFVLVLGGGVLPDTTLTLTRSDRGWRLAAQTSSSNSFDLLSRESEALKARFREHDLGELSVDTVFAADWAADRASTRTAV